MLFRSSCPSVVVTEGEWIQLLSLCPYTRGVACGLWVTGQLTALASQPWCVSVYPGEKFEWLQEWLTKTRRTFLHGTICAALCRVFYILYLKKVVVFIFISFEKEEDKVFHPLVYYPDAHSCRGCASLKLETPPGEAGNLVVKQVPINRKRNPKWGNQEPSQEFQDGMQYVKEWLHFAKYSDLNMPFYICLDPNLTCVVKRWPNYLQIPLTAISRLQ